MGEQQIEGDRNVQIQGAIDSFIQVSIDGATRAIPLERAMVPVPAGNPSPARLVRARSGVVPFTGRVDAQAALKGWLENPTPFAGEVIGGRGGAGKTRLAVELCRYAEANHWLCGFLSHKADHAALEALAETSTARLVVVDYAESRVSQLEALLPLLALRATPKAPVRALLLLREGPKVRDWTERMRNRNDFLDALLDEFKVQVLEDAPLSETERKALFEAAVHSFTERLKTGSKAPDPPEVLSEDVFANPLAVVIAAYLGAHGDPVPPTIQSALLDEMLAHEHRYWRGSGSDLFGDDVLPKRVVALATLMGAENETEAVERLRLIPDLADATAERRSLLARWAHEQYPGSGWWNPLEPDLLGEHLIVNTIGDMPGLLAGAFSKNEPGGVTRALEACALAATDYPDFAAVVKPILTSKLEHLCRMAVTQATAGDNHLLLYDNVTTIASATERAISVIGVEADSLPIALDLVSGGSNLLLAPLVATLSRERIADLRLLATGDSERDADLAHELNNFAIRLGTIGRNDEALDASEEAVGVWRLLVEAEPDTYMVDLARSLSVLPNRLSTVGRRTEALDASEKAVGVWRLLVEAEPDTFKAEYARSLNNLSNHLAEAGEPEKALGVIEEAVELWRQLAEADSDTYLTSLAESLSNLSNRLTELGRGEESLVGSEEAVEIFRRLAADDSVTYEADLARSLNNLSNHLSASERYEEAIAASEKSVEIRRRLNAANPDVHKPGLANSLSNFSTHLAKIGRKKESLVAIEGAVQVDRQLAAQNPSAYEPGLAGSLANFSNRLADLGRYEDALDAVEAAVEIYGRFAAYNPAAFGGYLAFTLHNLSLRLTEVGRPDEAERIRHQLPNPPERSS